MFTPQDPIIIRREANDDNTDEIVIGSMSPFDVTVVSNNDSSMYSSKYSNGHYYSYEDTLPSDANVRVSR